MTVSDPLQLSTFQGREGEVFQVRNGEAALDLVLSTVEPSALHSGQVGHTGRQPFAIEFIGPAAPLLPQRIYALEHPALGSFELFLVPLGRVPSGVRYEAVFT